MIKDNVLKAINDYNMLKANDTVTVALSGGADSVCLLHIMLSLSEPLGITVRAAHLNHSIRGEEADRDEAYVKKLCERLGVELISKKADVPSYANEHKMSLELAARQVRYDFLRSVGGIIATAHNADDNLETMLFNLTRGTALKGLCGIPPVRDGIIRPIIYCKRAEIEAYLRENNLDFVTDSTNLSDDYTRNKIRHNIIPILREINPSVEAAAARTANTLKADSEYLENIAEKELLNRLKDKKLSLDSFDKLDKAIAMRVLISFCRLSGIEDISNKHLSQLYYVALNGGECDLPNKTLKSFGNFLKLKEENTQKTEFSVEFFEVSPEEIENKKKINNLLLKNYLDCDKIVGKLVLRTREIGDSVKLKNKNGTKTLKKLYTEYKIPLKIRESLPLLADDNGVGWIYRIGVAERCATDKNSNKILKINVTERFGDNNDGI